jgi:hypothetical protein
VRVRVRVRVRLRVRVRVGLGVASAWTVAARKDMPAAESPVMPAAYGCSPIKYGCSPMTYGCSPGSPTVAAPVRLRLQPWFAYGCTLVCVKYEYTVVGAARHV